MTDIETIRVMLDAAEAGKKAANIIAIYAAKTGNDELAIELMEENKFDRAIAAGRAAIADADHIRDATKMVQPVSQEPRSSDDELWDQTLRERDAYHEWADKLADAISEHFGVDIGEHSNINHPWAKALDAILDAALQPVSQEPAMRKTTRDEKIVRPGVYEIPMEQPPQKPVGVYYGNVKGLGHRIRLDVEIPAGSKLYSVPQPVSQEPYRWILRLDNGVEIVTADKPDADELAFRTSMGDTYIEVYTAPQPVTTPDVCGEVCECAKLCYGCGKNFDEANAEHERKYGKQPVSQEPVLLWGDDKFAPHERPQKQPVSQEPVIPAFLRRPGSFGHE